MGIFEKFLERFKKMNDEIDVKKDTIVLHVVPGGFNIEGVKSEWKKGEGVKKDSKNVLQRKNSKKSKPKTVRKKV